LISFSVTSIEGNNYCAVLTNDCSEYRWAYGLKTKDELIDAVKQWYAEIADLREKYQLLELFLHTIRAMARWSG
jgi:hypothetical protein